MSELDYIGKSDAFIIITLFVASFWIGGERSAEHMAWKSVENVTDHSQSISRVLKGMDKHKTVKVGFPPQGIKRKLSFMFPWEDRAIELKCMTFYENGVY